mgnify:CR=1 FL=1
MSAEVIQIPKRGGSRPGSGRPYSGGPTTGVVRVPIQYANKDVQAELVALQALIADWDCRALDASKSSPRWEQLRVFLSEAKTKAPRLFVDLPY